MGVVRTVEGVRSLIVVNRKNWATCSLAKRSRREVMRSAVRQTQKTRTMAFCGGEVAGVGLFTEESSVTRQLVDELFASFGRAVDFEEADHVVEAGFGMRKIAGNREAASGIRLAGECRLAVEDVVQQSTLIWREVHVGMRIAVLFKNPLRGGEPIRLESRIEDELRADDLQAMMDGRGLWLPFRNAEWSSAIVCLQ